MKKRKRIIAYLILATGLLAVFSFLKAKYIRYSLANKAAKAKSQYFVGWETFENSPEAIEAYQKVIDNYPDTKWADDAQFMIGYLQYNLLKQTDEAIKSLQKVIDNYPNSEKSQFCEGGNVHTNYRTGATAQEMIGEIYEDTMQWGKAKEAYKKVITDYSLPANSYSSYRLGWIESNNLATAEIQKEKGEISEAEYFCKVGEAYFGDNYPGKATRWLEKSVKADPNLAKAYIALAHAHSYWGDVSFHYNDYDGEELAKLKTETKGKAEDILKTMLRKFPNHALADRAQFMLGKIYDYSVRNANHLWDGEKAIEAYTELINEYPDSEFVKKAKERIKVIREDLEKGIKPW